MSNSSRRRSPRRPVKAKGKRQPGEFSNRNSDGEAAVRASVRGAITLRARYPQVTAIGHDALCAHGGLTAALSGPARTSDQELARHAESAAERITHGLAAPARSAPRPRRTTAGNILPGARISRKPGDDK